MTESGDKSKMKKEMNKKINEANKTHQKEIDSEFAEDFDGVKFIEFIKNASGEEDEELVTLINKTFTFLKVFNQKTLNPSTSNKLIDDMYSNTEKQLTDKMTAKGKGGYNDALKAYLSKLKALTLEIKKIKSEYNTVTTEIYICEGQNKCKKYHEDDKLPDLFTACAIQTRKNKAPEIHCKNKKSITAKKEDMFSGGSKKKKRKSRRRRRKI